MIRNSLLLSCLLWRATVQASAPAPAFYAWKTRWNPSPVLIHELEKRHVTQIYLRLMDFDLDPETQLPTAMAPLQVIATLPKAIHFTPVVFLKNRLFEKMNKAEVKELAVQVGQVVVQNAARHFIFHELQIDCDWTISTQKNYFAFLEHLNENLHPKKILVSSTIRLHQVKYRTLTGVPPVKRGMLMFYNLGMLATDAKNSSIYNSVDASRYLSAIESYPLPLDVVFPLFSWIIQSRDSNIIELISDSSLEFENFLKSQHPLSDHEWIITRSQFHQGRYYREGDHLKEESTSPAELKKAVTQVLKSKKSPSEFGTIAFFDLNEKTLQQHRAQDLQHHVESFHAN